MAGLARSSLFARHVFGVMIFIEMHRVRDTMHRMGYRSASFTNRKRIHP
jgi:hypothetical protein